MLTEINYYLNEIFKLVLSEDTIKNYQKVFKKAINTQIIRVKHQGNNKFQGTILRSVEDIHLCFESQVKINKYSINNIFYILSYIYIIYFNPWTEF